MSDEDKLFPDLPGEPDPKKAYGDSSGWSGSETSRERAESEDEEGITDERAAETKAALIVAGFHGLTWYEYADKYNMHHGQASASLSRLHKLGVIVRLTLRRGMTKDETTGRMTKGSQVYVMPEFVDGRPTSKYTPNVSRKAVLDLMDEIDDRARVNDVIGVRRIVNIARDKWGKGITE